MSFFSKIAAGPFLSHLGCFVPAQERPSIIEAGEQFLPWPLFEFSETGIPKSSQQFNASMKFGDRTTALRRMSGVPRSRSVAPSTIYAAILCRRLRETFVANDSQVGIAVASTTATAGIAFDFEFRGLLEGWELVDPLVLPNTIPSALATQVAIATKAHSFAVSFIDGLLGFFSAVEFASAAIMGGRSRIGLVLGAEEIGPVQESAHRALSREITLCEGSVGLVLTDIAPANGGWRLALLGKGTVGPDSNIIPPEWRRAASLKILCRDDVPALYSLAPVFALSLLLEKQTDKAILYGLVPSRGWCALGFELE
jgi:hypothetical protein